MITKENLGTIERTEKHQRNCVYISSERRLYARTIASRIIAAQRAQIRVSRREDETKHNTTKIISPQLEGQSGGSFKSPDSDRMVRGEKSQTKHAAHRCVSNWAPKSARSPFLVSPASPARMRPMRRVTIRKDPHNCQILFPRKQKSSRFHSCRHEKIYLDWKKKKKWWDLETCLGEWETILLSL